MKNRPEQQHFITKAYQNNFCDSQGKVYIYDLKINKWRKTQPLNEFKENNFQTLYECENLDPYFLEKEFGKIEDLAIKIIDKIIKNKELPENNEELSYVINLMGIFGMRNPVKRDLLQKVHSQRPRAILKAITKDEDTYHSFMKQMQAEGIIKKIIPYKKALDDINNGKVVLQINHDKLIMSMLELSSYLVDLLAKKNWQLVEAHDGEFISSNNPLNIINIDDNTKHEPYFELKNNIITFPLSSHFALVSSSSEQTLKAVIIDKSVIDDINSITAYNGSTHILASKELKLPEKSVALALKNFHQGFSN